MSCHDDLKPLTLCRECKTVVPSLRKSTKARAAKAATQTVEVSVWEPVNFFVEGTPVTQGSMRAVRGKVFHEKGPQLRAWRKAVSDAAVKAGAKPLVEHQAVRVAITFYLLRPKSVKRGYPTAKQDVDKLIRAVFDALSDSVIADDGQVVEVSAVKFYAEAKPGAQISVTLAEDENIKVA